MTSDAFTIPSAGVVTICLDCFYAFHRCAAVDRDFRGLVGALVVIPLVERFRTQQSSKVAELVRTTA